MPFCLSHTAVECPPPTIENGGFNATGPILYGDVVTVVCDTGYQRNGADIINCLIDKTLDGTALCEGEFLIEENILNIEHIL